MGELLPFTTKTERLGQAPLPRYDDMTASERFDHLYSKTLVHMRDLTAMYRGTTRLTVDDEQALVGLVAHLRHLCNKLAGTTGDAHATTPNVG